MCKEYIVRTYRLPDYRYHSVRICVYVRAVDGNKFVYDCYDEKQARAFTDALDGLGFTKKRR